MFNIVLFQPQIPPNTGNIMRLCVNTGSRLHLVEPLGFGLTDARLRRAGLDYRHSAVFSRHPDEDSALALPGRHYAFTTTAELPYSEASFSEGDCLWFGPEQAGLPTEVLARFPREHTLRLPMVPDSRSLNLSNAVAVAVYEAWRQLGFRGADAQSSTECS